ncbi:MAG: hypothetical protein C4518_10020 [Desulfobacteraceae bacterium]|nr:MAG: hypothetical protein C4518_10020 [Desulfobacteraceae bacterium]
MKFYIRLTAIMLSLLFVCLCLFACEKEKKQGKVIVTEKEFWLDEYGKVTLSLNVKGKIKNAGDVDVKNIVVTGQCKTCGEVLISGRWFVSDTEKLPEQKDIINFLPAGAEEQFQFKGIAYFFTKAGETPSANPEGLEVFIESFEVVEK